MMAAAYVNGLQSEGVAATIKHFVANDQEHEHTAADSVVSEVCVAFDATPNRRSDPYNLACSARDISLSVCNIHVACGMVSNVFFTDLC